MSDNVTTTLDARQIPPPQKHPTIFQTFAGLSAGQSFILLNDHYPSLFIINLCTNMKGSSLGNISNKVPKFGACKLVALHQPN